MTKKRNKKETPETFDKYWYYKASVQSPDTDVEFLRDTFKELKGRKAKVLREDFCGTHAICCEWVKLDPENKAIGVDLDPEPIEYGQNNYVTQLTSEQQKRVEVHEANVLDPNLPPADVIAAMNFSYFTFKKRKDILDYFKAAREALNDDGLFIVDCMGGSQCMEPNEEETEHKDEGFSYYWDQDSYDPVTNFAKFYIHFKPKGMKKQEAVFSYEWRMWGLPEVRDLMEDAGFKKTYVYWEGTDEDGEGDGNFKRVEEGEDCEAWIAYIIGEK